MIAFSLTSSYCDDNDEAENEEFPLDVPENIPDNADAQSDEEMKSENQMSDAESADKDGSFCGFFSPKKGV